MKYDRILEIGGRQIMPVPYTFIHKYKKFTIKPGDILVFKNSVFGFFHHKVMYLGIDLFLGKPIFIENHPNGKGIRFVILWDLKNRYGNNTWKIEPFYGDFYRIVYRLSSNWGYLKNKKYDWLDWNCEHFVYYLRVGKKRSPQLEGVSKVATTLSVFALILFLLNN